MVSINFRLDRVLRWAIPGLFFFIFVFPIQQINILPVAGFELRTSGVKSNLYANWVTTTAHTLYYFSRAKFSATSPQITWPSKISNHAVRRLFSRRKWCHPHLKSLAQLQPPHPVSCVSPSTPTTPRSQETWTSKWVLTLSTVFSIIISNLLMNDPFVT